MKLHAHTYTDSSHAIRIIFGCAGADGHGRLERTSSTPQQQQQQQQQQRQEDHEQQQQPLPSLVPPPPRSAFRSSSVSAPQQQVPAPMHEAQPLCARTASNPLAPVAASSVLMSTNRAMIEEPCSAAAPDAAPAAARAARPPPAIASAAKVCVGVSHRVCVNARVRALNSALNCMHNQTCMMACHNIGHALPAVFGKSATIEGALKRQ